MRRMNDSFGFLFGDISRLLRRQFDERARTIGVTRPQWRVLLILTRNPGINQGGLAELLEVEPISACRMVDRLQEAGLVERRPDPADRRAWRLYLSDAARPLLDDLRLLGEELFEKAMTGLSSDERDELRRSLEAVRENLSFRPSDQSGVSING